MVVGQDMLCIWEGVQRVLLNRVLLSVECVLWILMECLTALLQLLHQLALCQLAVVNQSQWQALNCLVLLACAAYDVNGIVLPLSISISISISTFC